VWVAPRIRGLEPLAAESRRRLTWLAIFGCASLLLYMLVSDYHYAHSGKPDLVFGIVKESAAQKK